MSQTRDLDLTEYAPANASARIEEARAAEKQGQHALARERYETALRTLRPGDDPALAAALLRWVGNMHRGNGDNEAALDCFTASAAVAEVNGDVRNLAHAHVSVGTIYWQWGQLDMADEYYDLADHLAHDIGDTRIIAMVNINKGVVANVRGDLHAALQHYQASIAEYRKLGDEATLAPVLNNLAMLQTDLQQWQDAETTFNEAAAISETTGDFRTRIMVEANRTELFLLMGELMRAREACDAAFELASRYEHQLGLGEIYKWYGVIYREMGKFSLAETHLRTASEIAERYTHPLLAGEVQRELAEVYRVQDRNRDALLALNYAHRVFNDLRAQLDLAETDRRIRDLEELFMEVVRKWGESIESKDHYTAGHCERVADYSCMLARAVGFDDQTIVWFRMGAFLHDVGKTAIPAEILNKEGKLSPEEWELMKQHTIRGVELLSAIEFPWDVKPMVRSHHERWDGSGYPEALQGRAIPLSARILCVADVFDALTTTRSYRKAYTFEEALEIMDGDSGKIFDPEVFGLFRKALSDSTVDTPVAAS